MRYLTCLENPLGDTGFVFGWDRAFLGNCLSAMSNLLTFSMRTGVPVAYPDILDYAGLFALGDAPRPYLYPAQGGLDGASAERLRSFLRPRWNDFYHPGASAVQAVKLAEIGRLRRLSGAILFVEHKQEFRDWLDHEDEVAEFCGRGNGVILPGAYWVQYKEAPLEYAGAIRDLLALRHQDRSAARRQAMAKAAGLPLTVGIHIRQGDYARWHGGRYCYATETYADVMRRINQSLGTTPHLFVVCSSVPVDPGAFEGLPICYERTDSYDDFAALAACDYVVGPPSTFGSWAAFLGRKERLMLTPESLEAAAQTGTPLAAASQVVFPNASGVPGEFWNYMPEAPVSRDAAPSSTPLLA